MDHTLQLVDSVCNVIGTLFVLVGGIIALYKWCAAIRAQRAETMARLFELCQQKEVYMTFNFYVLGEKKLPKPFYLGNLEFADPEGKDHKPANVKTRIDTMLTFFNQVCYMKEHGIIEDEEFVVFERQIRRLFGSSQIKKYLLALQQEPESASPYELLVDYAKSKGWWPCKC